MTKRIAQIVGIVVALLALVGLVSGDQQLWGIMNTDIAMDLIRIPIAAALLYAGFGTRDGRTITSIVMAVGVLYVGMALLGLASPSFLGLLPHTLTGFDIAFHLVVGAISIASAATDSAHHHSAHGAV
ncbi:MAG TPA: hypothetical protein VLA88_02350 [Candidatus Saccharimonadales bacterium]|nr:hypothetical protein [Candidatus Saccharimonadales bacterium]